MTALGCRENESIIQPNYFIVKVMNHFLIILGCKLLAQNHIRKLICLKNYLETKLARITCRTYVKYDI